MIEISKIIENTEYIEIDQNLKPFKRENNSQKPAPKKSNHFIYLFIYYPFTNHYSTLLGNERAEGYCPDGTYRILVMETSLPNKNCINIVEYRVIMSQFYIHTQYKLYITCQKKEPLAPASSMCFNKRRFYIPVGSQSSRYGNRAAPA